MSRLVYLDTETTGLDPERNEVWEVATITEDGRERVWWLPVHMPRADLIALNISGFYDRHPSYGGSDGMGGGNALSSLDGFAYDFARLTRGAHLVGAVPSFDAAFLSRLLLDCDELPAWHYHLIDVEAMAVGYLHGFERCREPVADASWLTITLPWASDDLSRACGVEPPGDDERHTALGDARWVKRWYEAITGDA